MMSPETETSIRVVLRTRPTQNFASKNITLDTMDNAISIHVPKSEDKGVINNQKESWNFKFDKILHNVSQEEVFEFCSKEIVSKALEGYNGTVFAYGQTGSGKTFSMSGSTNNYNYRGVVPRAITRVFQEIGGKPEFDFVVKVSYLEIYNETLFDLLSPIPTHEQKGDITFQEDNKGNFIIKGLSKHTVVNEEEAFNLVFEGEANRTISEHQLNKESTRSHCIFSVYLEMKSRIESSEKVITSKLNFVDLAGSERVKKTGSTGITLKEANFINKSLTFLEQVVVSLTDKGKKAGKQDHVPYRQSKLTHLLKDSIGGNCRTVMIATIWPEEPYLFETLSTLNFARRMMNVVNEASVNIQLDTNALLKKYQKEIKELKQELAMHNTLTNKGRINYDPYTAEEQYLQQTQAKKFLVGEIEDLEFESVRQAKELFCQCRILFQKLWTSRDVNEGVVDNKLSNNLQTKLSLKKISTDHDDRVGDLEVKPSFGLGIAPRDARPVNKCMYYFNSLVELSAQNINHLSDQEEEKNEKMKKEDEVKMTEERVDNEPIPEKNVAFQMFKSESSQAKDIEQNIHRNSEELKKRKTEAKFYLEQCNGLKSKIDSLKSILGEKKKNKLNIGDEMTELIDEEGYKLIDELKGVKESYKESLDKFKFSKSEINYIKNNLDLMKVKYVESFENWFLKKYGIKLEEHELKLTKNKYGLNVDDDEYQNRAVDPEEQAYFNAKKKVQSIHKAKKMEKRK